MIQEKTALYRSLSRALVGAALPATPGLKIKWLVLRRVRFIVRWEMAWGWAPQRDWWGAWDRGLRGAGGLPRSMLCGGARRTGQTLHRHAVRQATGKAQTLSLSLYNAVLKCAYYYLLPIKGRQSDTLKIGSAAI